MNLKTKEWNASYQNRDNFLFYPHEEVIRFVSNYIRRKIGSDRYIDIHRGPASPKVIDLGCGIGRHVKFLHEYGLDAVGIDLSNAAVNTAQAHFSSQNLSHLSRRLVVGDLMHMPFPDGFFDYAVSHGVFGSMTFQIARGAMREAARCLKEGALFYVDLISGDDSNHFPEFCGEEIVETEHEKGTVQSYYNWFKITELVKGLFLIKEASLIKKRSVISLDFHARYHLILEKPAEDITHDKGRP